MSRLTEALRRANERAASVPVETHAPFDTFPVEADIAENPHVGVPVSPILPPPGAVGPAGPAGPVSDEVPLQAEDQTLTRRQDSTHRRVQVDGAGRRIQTDPSGRQVQTDGNGRSIDDLRGPGAPETQLAVFTEYNKKLV